MIISDEQKAIIAAAKNNDIVVDAVAGSGKTTTSLFIAQEYPDKQILLITYNKKLKLETRQKVREMGIANLEVHSYHSFCVKYYHRRCFTDQNMYQVVSDSYTPIRPFSYNMIIVDEVQDMTPLYFKLIKKILTVKCQLLLFGDVRQSIYDFKMADGRFLIYADKLFGRKFLKLNLSKSFRLTTSLADFVNKVLFGRKFIKGVTAADSPRPYYYVGYPFGDILKKLTPHGFEFTTNIFVIAPSLRSDKTPARKLANQFTKQGIPIYVPISDEEKLDQDVLEGKIVFSTIHQAKGLECDTVILYGFDASYFKYYKRNCNKYICPNELYVACTRAKRQLVLVHSSDQSYLPFVDPKLLDEHCNVIMRRAPKMRKMDKSPPPISVTNLVRHLPSYLVKTLMEQISIKVVDRGEAPVPIPIKIQQGDLVESISEITGTAIPLYYEYLCGDKCELYEICQRLDESVPDPVVISDVLRISNLWCAKKSGYNFKTKQVTDYDWVSEDSLECCIEHLQKYIPPLAFFEKKLENMMNKWDIIGYADCIIDGVVWELKCVSELQPEHVLQTIVYNYLNGNGHSCRLMNILTREVWGISCGSSKAIVAQLLEYKLLGTQKITDEEFIKTNT